MGWVVEGGQKEEKKGCVEGATEIYERRESFWSV